MVRTGIEKIKVPTEKGANRFCFSCRRLARNRVTFEDNYGKVIVCLCDACAEKDLDNLLIQETCVRSVSFDLDE